MLKTPSWDSGFITSGSHGADAQKTIIARALRECKNFRVALDGGAHVGIWTAALAPHFQVVVAVEPQAENYDLLRSNLDELGLSNTVSLRCALGLTQGKGHMVLPTKGNSGCYQLEPGLGDTCVVAIDYILSGMPVDLIKLDLEGFEPAALKGGIEVLTAWRPVVVVENKKHWQRYGFESPAVVLESLGYRMVDKIKRDEVWISSR